MKHYGFINMYIIIIMVKLILELYYYFDLHNYKKKTGFGSTDLHISHTVLSLSTDFTKKKKVVRVGTQSSRC